MTSELRALRRTYLLNFSPALQANVTLTTIVKKIIDGG